MSPLGKKIRLRKQNGRHACAVGRDGIPVRRSDSQSREPGFKSHCGRFETFGKFDHPTLPQFTQLYK